MSTDTTREIVSTNLDSTLEIASRIGENLKGNETIELKGDLGSGKTVFVKGLAAGAGCLDVVSSPSFTISNQYETDSFLINHYDFYRLDQVGIAGLEFAEALKEDGVVVIEWAKDLDGVLPDDRLKVNLEFIEDVNSRRILIKFPEVLSYLNKGLK